MTNFRCLTENGNVAFAKHTTVFENTDGNNMDDWAKDLSSNVRGLNCKFKIGFKTNSNISLRRFCAGSRGERVNQ